MREVSVSCSRFAVCEHDESDYRMCLTRSTGEGRPAEEVHLYVVVVQTPASIAKVFVLAESPEGAADQAKCSLKMPSGDRDNTVTTHVERVPLIIRGWGGTQF